MSLKELNKLTGSDLNNMTKNELIKVYDEYNRAVKRRIKSLRQAHLEKMSPAYKSAKENKLIGKQSYGRNLSHQELRKRIVVRMNFLRMKTSTVRGMRRLINRIGVPYSSQPKALEYLSNYMKVYLAMLSQFRTDIINGILNSDRISDEVNRVYAEHRGNFSDWHEWEQRAHDQLKNIVDEYEQLYKQSKGSVYYD